MGERMQWSEAEAVVRAYRAERGSTDVDVETLARALGTDVADVRRLAGRRPPFIDGSGILSAALATAVVAGAFILAGESLLRKNPLLTLLKPTSSVMPAPPICFETIPMPPMELEVAERVEMQKDGMPVSGSHLRIEIHRATDET